MINDSIPFDQFQRYKMSQELINSLRQKGRVFNILEVGANEQKRLELFLPNDKILYLDNNLPKSLHNDPSFIEADATELHFDDDSFDIIIGLDVFEHIKPHQREKFLDELYRVSRICFILAAPFNNETIVKAEERANDFYKKLFGVNHPWIEEHISNGLPCLEDTLEYLSLKSNHCFSFQHGNIFIWEQMIKVHFLSQIDQEFLANRLVLDDYYNKEIFQMDYYEQCYREFIILFKKSNKFKITKLEKDIKRIKKYWPDRKKIMGFQFSAFDYLSEAMSQALKNKYLEIEQKNQEIEQKNQEIQQKNQEIQQKNQEIEQKNQELERLVNSKSWRITAPLRKVDKLIREAVSLLRDKVFKLSIIIVRNIKKNFTERHLTYLILKQSCGDNYIGYEKYPAINEKPVKLICFYLPQFHSIPENDAWWGEGFTEWTYVKAAKPQFEGHNQPKVPGDLGYYNLLETQVMKKQAALADNYGIGGFCFYFYWFAGKRLLEKPVQNYFNNKDITLPFCLCWANENWTRRWDGLDQEVLIAQRHSAADDLAFITYVSKYFNDPRYIRVHGKPLLIVYRPGLLPDITSTVSRWRKWCNENGVGNIHLAYVQSFDYASPDLYGFDAAIEFPPNDSSPKGLTQHVKPLNSDFNCSVLDWRVLAARSMKYNKPDYTIYRGLCPSWDNTPRRNNNSTIFVLNSPDRYQAWLQKAIVDTIKRFEFDDDRLIFINAWNEWAEGAYLEPDEKLGYAYLQATHSAQIECLSSNKKLNTNKPIAVVLHAFYTEILDEIISHLSLLANIPLSLYVTTTHEQYLTVNQRVKQLPFPSLIMPLDNRGRDILPFIKIMPEVIKNNHDYLIKIHTKKSLHRTDGDIWRNDMYGKLLSKNNLIAIYEYMVAHSNIGILGPTGHVVPMSYYYGSNANFIEAMAWRLGVENTIVHNLNFVAGSMFMARVDAILPLLNLRLSDGDFEPETGQIDGTLAHAIERLFSVIAYSKGYDTTCLNGQITVDYKHV